MNDPKTTLEPHGIGAQTISGWEAVGRGPPGSGLLWRKRAEQGFLYALFNTETRTYAMTFVPEVRML